MRAREFIVEYDRSRAATAVGQNLWKAMLRDKLQMRVSLANFDSEFQQKYPTAWKQYSHILTDPNAQKALINNALEELESADPTANKKYTQWLARMFAKDPATKIEDIKSTAAEYLAKFNKLGLKKMLKPEHGDLNRYKSLKDFMNIIDQYNLPDDDDAQKGQAEKLYSDSNVTIIHPQDQAAACQYGRQTRWCTAATKGSNFFNHYNKDGPLYILIPKKPKHEGEKYQLHFQSGQHMDEDDEPVSLHYLFDERFPGIREFFLKKETKALKNSFDAASSEEIESITGKITGYLKDQIDKIITDMRDNDDAYMDWLYDMEYVDQDGDVNWDEAPPYTEFNPEIEEVYERMLEAIDMSAEEARKFIKHIEDYDGDEYTKITDLPEVFSYKISDSLNPDEGRDELLDIVDRIKLKLDGTEWTVHLVKQKQT